MKKIILLLAITISWASCSLNAERTKDINVVGVWKLYKIRGSMVNVETEGEMMSFQEQLNLKEDGSFTKTRIFADSDEIVTESGTYVSAFSTEEPGKTKILLTYPENSELISSCSEVEELTVSVPNFMDNNSWAPCDGPFLYYRREAGLNSL